jgi:NADPH:quinone reductase-like Zn-dependent oxidoreductase
MKAAVRHKYIPGEDLSISEVERPSPKADEVLVRVHATTVNRTDCSLVSGKPVIFRLFVGLPNPRLPIVGTDFAGVVESVGSAVTSFSPGDKVFGFSDTGLASQAEYMTIGQSKNIMHMPEDQSFYEAVASLEAAHYARNFIRAVKPRSGQHVLLIGATGGIGSALLQMLNAMNVRVTAVCGTPHLERIRALGADDVIDYLHEDFSLRPTQYDHIFDAVGKSSFGTCRPILKMGGTYSSSELGPRNENPFLAIVTKFGAKKRVIFPVPSDIKQSMSYITDLIDQGKFRPLIDREYSFEEIGEAYRYVAAGQKIGNVILRIG